MARSLKSVSLNYNTGILKVECTTISNYQGDDTYFYDGQKQYLGKCSNKGNKNGYSVNIGTIEGVRKYLQSTISGSKTLFVTCQVHGSLATAEEQYHAFSNIPSLSNYGSFYFYSDYNDGQQKYKEISIGTTPKSYLFEYYYKFKLNENTTLPSYYKPFSFIHIANNTSTTVNVINNQGEPIAIYNKHYVEIDPNSTVSRFSFPPLLYVYVGENIIDQNWAIPWYPFGVKKIKYNNGTERIYNIQNNKYYFCFSQTDKATTQIDQNYYLSLEINDISIEVKKENRIVNNHDYSYFYFILPDQIFSGNSSSRGNCRLILTNKFSNNSYETILCHYYYEAPEQITDDAIFTISRLYGEKDQTGSNIYSSNTINWTITNKDSDLDYFLGDLFEDSPNNFITFANGATSANGNFPLSDANNFNTIFCQSYKKTDINQLDIDNISKTISLYTEVKKQEYINLPIHKNNIPDFLIEYYTDIKQLVIKTLDNGGDIGENKEHTYNLTKHLPKYLGFNYKDSIIKINDNSYTYDQWGTDGQILPINQDFSSSIINDKIKIKIEVGSNTFIEESYSVTQKTSIKPFLSLRNGYLGINTSDIDNNTQYPNALIVIEKYGDGNLTPYRNTIYLENGITIEGLTLSANDIVNALNSGNVVFSGGTWNTSP